jgi:Protein kinase domain
MVAVTRCDTCSGVHRHPSPLRKRNNNRRQSAASIEATAMKVDVARVLPTGATDVEPARAFLQDRIGLWAFWVFVLSFGFYVTNIVTWTFMRHASARLADMMLQASSLDHLAASIVFGAVWVLTRRVRLSMRALRLLDLATLTVGCMLFALMGAALMRLQSAAGLDPAMGAYAGLLACANTVMARAIAVPSSPRRTLLASIVAMAPLVAATLVVSRGAAIVTVNVATWCGVSIVIAVVGSRVIFGLRMEAARVRRLGQYTLENKIGSGGMGIVYRASHAMLRRPTAIKLLPPDRAGEASLVRFEREVQMTAQLSHPNTVAIYDYGRTPDGVFYYAMEYLDGINLEDLVRVHGPQPAGRVIAILDQVCGSLMEAHGRGLVHRDIKSANIILTERGGTRRGEGGGLRARQATRAEQSRSDDAGDERVDRDASLHVARDANDGAGRRSAKRPLCTRSGWVLPSHRTLRVRGGDGGRDHRPSSPHRAGAAVAAYGPTNSTRPRGACPAVSSQTTGGQATRRSGAARGVACVCARAAVDERRRRSVVELLPICRERNRTPRCGFGPRPHRHRGHSGSPDAGGEQSRCSHELTSPRSRGRLRLGSADPATQPGRTPAFYDEPSDLESMKTALRALLLIAGREPLVHRSWTRATTSLTRGSRPK